MEEKELSTAQEVSYKSDIWDFREEVHQLLQHATRVLARRTNLLAAATTNLGDVYYYGVGNVLQFREFWDVKTACNFLDRLDEITFFKSILDEFKKLESELLFLMGEEDLKDHGLEEYASVFGEFEGKTIKGAIGVMGPKRMPYEIIVPNVKYFTHLIESIIREQGL